MKPLYNYRKYYGFRTWQKLLFFLLFFSFISISFKFHADLWNVFGASSVFLSIILGFFLASATSNLSRLKTLIAQECGILITLYNFISEFDPKIKEKIGNLIDNYIIKRFDWELENYIENTEDDIENIYREIESKEIKAKNEKQKQILYFCRVSRLSLSQIRQEISVVSKSVLNKFYWTLLLLLSFLVISTIFISSEKNFTGYVSSILLSVAVVVALLILDDVDKNKLNEDIIAFQNYNRVLESIGKLPYYLEIDIKSKRVKPPKGKPYRLGVYKNFPYSFEKDIKVVEIN